MGRREYQKKLRVIDRNLELADRFLTLARDELSLLREQFGDLAQSAAESVGRSRRERRRIDVAEQAARAHAAAGVRSVKITWLDDARAEVRIDDFPPQQYSRKVALVFAALCAATDRMEGDDHLVGWKTIGEINKHVEAGCGRALTRHATIQLISRLKKLAPNPFLVQSDPKRAMYRFALRRDGRFVLTSPTI